MDNETLQFLLQRIIDLTKENEQLRAENERLKKENLEIQASAMRDYRAYREERYGRC